MSVPPPPRARYAVYARYSTDHMSASPTEAPRAQGVEFDPAQAIVRRIHADYTAGLSSMAIAQALNDADQGGAS